LGNRPSGDGWVFAGCLFGRLPSVDIVASHKNFSFFHMFLPIFPLTKRGLTE
jgi:hypothetical protein